MKINHPENTVDQAISALLEYGFADADLIRELGEILPQMAKSLLEKAALAGGDNLCLKAIDLLKDAGGTKVLPVLMDLALNSGPALQSRAISAIGEIGSSDTVPFIAGFLKEKDRRIRANAVEALAKLRDRCIIPLLLPLLEDEDNRVQANTALALWQFNDQQDRVRKTFEKMLKDGRKWKRASAYYAFGEIGLEEFVAELLNALDDPDEDLARNAVLALIGYSEGKKEEYSLF